MSPFFSIIIPAYNAEPFIRKCLDTILSQKFTDFEIIVINDQSSDKTGNIVEEKAKKDARIILLNTPVNTGNPFKARKYGIDRAVGKYMIFIDADDFISLHFLDKIYETIRKNHFPDMVLTEMWKGSENNFKKILPKPDIKTNETFEGTELVIYTLDGFKIPTAGAIKSQIIRQAYERIPENQIETFFADEILGRWFLILSQNVAFTNAIYYYTHNPESVTNKDTAANFSGILKRNEALLDFCVDRFKKDSPEYNKAMRQKLQFIIEGINLINTVSPEHKPRLKAEIKEAKKKINFSMKPYLSFPYRLILRSPHWMSPSLAALIFKLRRT